MRDQPGPVQSSGLVINPKGPPSQGLPSHVGAQGHQKPLENTKTLMKKDVFLCPVVQEPGVYRGGSAPPRTPLFMSSGAV